MGSANLGVLLFSYFVKWVVCHGSLDEPPQRSSMWRFGFNTPENYDDISLNCGGLANQWEVNQGRCGCCGDPYQGPLHHSPGGKYYTGIIARTYKQGAMIPVTIRLSAPHQGYFEFRLCQLGDRSTSEDHACFERNLLYVGKSSATRYYPGPTSGNISLHVQLPPSIICKHCVFQWKYRAGNSWGCDPGDKCGLGNGPQEHYFNCADIAILPSAANGSGSGVTRTSSLHLRTSTLPQTYRTVHPSTRATTRFTTTKARPTTTAAETRRDSSATRPPKKATTRFTMPRAGQPATTAAGSHNSTCEAQGVWVTVAGMTNWCNANCPGYCPSSFCLCQYSENV